MRKENRLLGIANSLLISVVLIQQDSDSNVSTQASFKLNSCRTAMREALAIATEAETDSAYLLSADKALTTLLSISSTPYSSTAAAAPAEAPGGDRRTTLRADVRAAVLRWVAKEAPDYLVDNALDCIRCARSNFIASNDQSQSGMRLKLSSALVLEKLLIAYPATALAQLESIAFSDANIESSSGQSFASVLFEIATVALGHSMPLSARNSSLSTTSTVNSGLASENSDQVEIRRLVYNIFDRICRVFPEKAVSDSSIVHALFRLLPVEDDAVMPSLFCALGALKTAYELHESAVALLSGGVQDGNSLESLLRRSRGSSSPKPRLVALTWCRSLYKWNDFVLETMFCLLGDTSEVVSNAVIEEFKKLQQFLLFNICSDLAISQDVLKALAALLPSQLSLVKSATGVEDKNKSILALYYCLGCITVGLKGLMQGSELHFAPQQSKGVKSNSPPDAANRIGVSEILDEYALSFGSPVQWPLVPSLLAVSSSGSQTVDCMRNCVSYFADVVLLDASVCSNLFHVLSSSEGATFCGPAAAVNEDTVSPPLLNELILHLLYQVILLRDKMAVQLCKTMQSMSPQLLSVMNGSSTQSVSTECAARLLALLCLIDPEGAGSIEVLDADFMQALTRNLHHKFASAIESGRIRESAIGAACGSVRCTEAILEVVLCNSNVSIVNNATDQVELPAFFVSYCIDTIVNIVECLEHFTGSDIQAPSASKTRQQQLIDPRWIPVSNADSSSDAGGSTAEEVVTMLLRLLSTVVMRGAVRCPASAYEHLDKSDQTSKATSSGFIDQIFGRLQCQGIDDRIFAILTRIIALEREKTAPSKRKSGGAVLRKHYLVYSATLDVMGRLFWPIWNSFKDNPKPIIWKDLISPTSLSLCDGGSMFAMGECLSKVLLSCGSSSNDLLDELILFSEGITFAADKEPSPISTDGAPDVDLRGVKGTIATIVLVLLKQSCDNYAVNPKHFVMSFSQLNRLCIILLKLLGSLEKLTADNDPLVQDACCAGLCFCYQFAKCLNQSVVAGRESSSSTSSNEIPLHEVLANTVIYTLTRDKKLPQPAGMAPAGERSAVEGVAGAHSGNTPAGNLPEGGGDDEEQDPLAAAAAEAAARIGLSAADLNALRNADRAASVEQLMGGMRADRVAASEGDYGVYTKACKVAKKSGDPSVVFSVLALIRRNPAVVGSSVLYDTYWPQVAQVDLSKRQVLLPMLYVSKFDPSPPVKAVMKSLWERLIPADDVASLLTAHTSGIIKYALSQTSSRAWRDRECGCLALEAFISQRSWKEIFPFLEQLWYAGMQVLDDIRESTRAAAIGYTKVLSQQIMRACSPETNSSSVAAGNSLTGGSTREKKRKRDEDVNADLEATTAVVIPILLDKGLVAQSQEGRGFSLGLLVQIVKVSRESLQEHLVRIIDILIESMAALEPRTLQYMQFHTARLNISEKELEDLRLSLSQHSPMQEALDICLQSLPASYLPSVIYQLGAQLRGGVGLATRVSAVKSLVRLLESSNLEFRKSDGALARVVFEACLSVLLQFDITSTGLKSSMLACLSAAALCVPGDYLSSQCLHLVQRYSAQFSSRFEATETLIIAESLGHIIRRAGDQLEHDSDAWGPILSCSYIGSFHPDEEVAKAWMSTWSEALTFSGCGNKYSALVKTLPMVVNQICELLHSLSWVQRTVGLAVSRDVASNLPFEVIGMHLHDLVVALLACVKFRIWSGQSSVLETLVAVLEKYRRVYLYESWGHTDVTKPPVPGSMGRKAADSGSISDETAEEDNVSHQYVFVESLIRKSKASASDSENNRLMVEVSCPAVIDLLLAEAVRGEKAYRYSAAKALSEMHESWIYLSANYPAVTTRYLNVLISLAGIRTEAIAPVVVMNAGAETDSNSASTTMSMAPAAKSRSAPPASSNMFGDRYSKHLPAKGSVKQPSQSTARAAARAAREEARTPSGARAAEAAVTQSSESIDPAFRVKLMECVYYAWPRAESVSETMDICSADDSPKLLTCRIEVLQWIFSVSKGETWSIKRQGLLILSSVVSRWVSIPKEDLNKAVEFISESYTTNSMHNQVREAALFCLRRILEDSKDPTITSWLKNDFAHDIRVLLLQAQSDSAPGAQDELQRIRGMWKGASS